MSASSKVIHPVVISPDLVLKIAIQSTIVPVSPKYCYPGEEGINPAWEAVESVRRPLRLHEKRIFVLRSDFVLATGIKNAEEQHGYEGLKETFDPSVWQFIDWQDRYGHPSLLIADETGDNRAYQAGFVCQRESGLQVFLSSGRFNRSGRGHEGIALLDAEQTAFLETLLTIRFNAAYGEQSVVFYDTTPEDDDADSALFFRNLPFPGSKPFRLYTPERLAEVVRRAIVVTGLGAAEQYIRKQIPPVSPKYTYAHEGAINPGYQDIAAVRGTLRPGEKRIWALRSDLILATGVKNAYEKEYGYTGFAESFSPSLHPLINWQDRYGHPSLALPEGDYDGAVIYAGYICQRDGFLQVYLVSGRFERTDLDAQQKEVLEACIAAQFQAVYGLQDLVFDDGDSDDVRYHTAFFGGGYGGRGSLEGAPGRRYDTQRIQAILHGIPESEPPVLEAQQKPGGNGSVRL